MKMQNRNWRIVKTMFASIMGLLLLVTPAFAHVVVKPDEAGIGAYKSFTIGVPSEKENATVGLRLVLPKGLESVTPNVKPGWTIAIKKEGEGENATVTEIVWTGGAIPSGQRDDFMFTAQMPANETTLQWKAYQTYDDGTVVSWDQKPTSDEKDDDSASTGPYSETKVINDLKPTAQPVAPKEGTSSTTNMLSLVAILFSITAVAMQLRSRK